MSNPPRRSRPKRPGRTIDLTAERSGTVGYAGPMSSKDATDPQTGLDETASDGAHAGHVVGEAFPETGAEPPMTGAEETMRGFAEDEGLVDPGDRDRPAEEFEDETILAAAEPDLAAREGTFPGSGAPATPSYDYNATSALSQPERGGGFGSALGGGLVGALLALLGGGLLQYAGVLPSFGGRDPAALSQQFASVGDVQQVTADFTTLRGDVEQLKSAQAAGGAGAGATSADLNAVADRVTAIEQRAAQAPATPEAPTVDPAALDAIRTGADDARRIAGEAKQAADGAANAVAAIRQTAESAGTNANNARQTADNALQSAATAQQTATTAQGAAAAAQGAATAAQDTANAAQGTIGGFEPRVAAIEASSRQAAVAIAAASLKSTIDEGRPFMAALERFAVVTGPSPAIETLRGFAASGVPSRAALAGDWPQTEAAIRDALRPAPAEGDVGAQVMSGLSALVTVRQATPAPAATEGPDAGLSRLSGAIASGDLPAFLGEWDKLPDAAKQVSADFAGKVRARAETDRVVGDTLNTAVEATGTAG